jgi:hypothetical protein
LGLQGIYTSAGGTRQADAIISAARMPLAWRHTVPFHALLCKRETGHVQGTGSARWHSAAAVCLCVCVSVRLCGCEAGQGCEACTGVRQSKGVMRARDRGARHKSFAAAGLRTNQTSSCQGSAVRTCRQRGKRPTYQSRAGTPKNAEARQTPAPARHAWYTVPSSRSHP